MSDRRWSQLQRPKKLHGGTIRFPREDASPLRPRVCGQGLLQRFRRTGPRYRSNQGGYETDNYSSDMVSVELAADTMSMPSKLVKSNDVDDSIPQFVIKMDPNELKQIREEKEQDNKKKRGEIKHEMFGNAATEPDAETKEQNIKRQTLAQQQTVRTVMDYKKSLFDTDSSFGTFFKDPMPETLEPLKEENSIVDDSEPSTEQTNRESIIMSPGCSAGSSSLIQRFFTTEKSENGSSKHSDLSSPIFGFFGTKSTEASISSGQVSMDKSSKQMLATMQRMMLQQQESIKAITEQNEYFKSMLLTYQKQMDRLTKESTHYQEAMAQLVDQKVTIEKESLWLKREIENLRTELQDIKSDNDLQERWSKLMEDDDTSTKSNTDESTDHDGPSVGPRSTVSQNDSTVFISESFEKEIMNVTPLPSADIVENDNELPIKSGKVRIHYEVGPQPKQSSAALKKSPLLPRTAPKSEELRPRDRSNQQQATIDHRPLSSEQANLPAVSSERTDSYAASSNAQFHELYLYHKERNKSVQNYEHQGQRKSPARFSVTSGYDTSEQQDSDASEPFKAASSPGEQIHSPVLPRERNISNPQSDAIVFETIAQDPVDQEQQNTESERTIRDASKSLVFPSGENIIHVPTTSLPSRMVSPQPNQRHAVSEPMQQNRHVHAHVPATKENPRKSESPISETYYSSNNHRSPLETAGIYSSPSGRNKSNEKTLSLPEMHSPQQRIRFAASLTANKTLGSGREEQRKPEDTVSKHTKDVSNKQQAIRELPESSSGSISSTGVRDISKVWTNSAERKSLRQNARNAGEQPKKLTSESYYPHSKAFHQGLARFQNKQQKEGGASKKGQSVPDSSRDGVAARRQLFERTSGQMRDENLVKRELKAVHLTSHSEADDPDISVSSEDVHQLYQGISDNHRDEVAHFKNRLDEVQRKRRERQSTSPIKSRSPIVRFGGVQSSEYSGFEGV